MRNEMQSSRVAELFGTGHCVVNKRFGRRAVNRQSESNFRFAAAVHELSIKIKCMVKVSNVSISNYSTQRYIAADAGEYHNRSVQLPVIKTIIKDHYAQQEL